MSLQEILELPAAERILLVEQIWDSINPDQIQISKAQKDEIARRKKLDESGQMKWYSLDEVKNHLRKNP